MAEFPVDPMISKMIIASEKYHCSEEVIPLFNLSLQHPSSFGISYPLLVELFSADH